MDWDEWADAPRWHPGAKAALVEAAPLVTAFEDDLGEELHAALGLMTHPTRFLAGYQAVGELVQVAPELGPHLPAVARTLARIASIPFRGRHFAATRLVELASDARAEGRQAALLPAGWLDTWARAPLCSLEPLASRVRHCLGGPTREPSYAEAMSQDDYVDYAGRADATLTGARPDLPFGLLTAFRAARARVAFRTDARGLGVAAARRPGATLFAVDRWGPGPPLGHAGWAPSDDGQATLIVSIHAPSRAERLLGDVVAAITRRAFADPQLHALHAQAGEDAALRRLGFEARGGGWVLTRSDYEALTTVAPPPLPSSVEVP